ncbi:toxin Y4kP [Aliidongia dinghuensis]|uniref:Toxin Y4kP n=1 Tax=Aliidongia dinghuensis TaxID=1867774 RepID=A0A8J2YU23_9PROT|nr:type II toxin-antitoxin system RelE/ParE family toxin [Aliidongia dinghuensis]GGF21993.1 toxin Y4kP [Aliidongia dinghuensis]
MSVDIRWTRRALRRLDEIGTYIGKDNPMAANHVVMTIVAGVLRLRDRPLTGRLGRVAGTRELSIGGTNYIVAYRIVQDDVEILTILHAAQAWPDVL